MRTNRTNRRRTAIALVALAGIREKLRYSDVPDGLQGLGITFIIVGLMSLAFMGFAGLWSYRHGRILRRNRRDFYRRRRMGFGGTVDLATRAPRTLDSATLFTTFPEIGSAEAGDVRLGDENGPQLRFLDLPYAWPEEEKENTKQ